MELDVLHRQIRERIGAVLRAAGEEKDRVVVPACPDWTVAQLIAHLAGTTVALVGGSFPKGDPQPWVDAHVEARADRSAIENWEEWDQVGPAFEQMLRAKPAIFGSLLYDAIIHEDDLNGALDRPSPRDETAVRYGLERVAEHIGRDARRHGIGTMVATIGGQIYRLGDGEPEVSITIEDPWEGLRSLGSRRSAAQLHAIEFPGVWRSVLPSDLPLSDLIER